MTCTDLQFDSVLAAMTEGKTIKQACDYVGVNIAAFQYKVNSGGNEQSIRYARAIEQRADYWADETVSISDDPEKDPNRARNQIQARQWVASKHNKRYGDRIDLNVSQSLDITAILADARGRVRPICDPTKTIEMQVVENKQINTISATDNESDYLDIFS